MSCNRIQWYGFALVSALLLLLVLLSQLVPATEITPIHLSSKKGKIIQQWIDENKDKTEIEDQSIIISMYCNHSTKYTPFNL